MNKQDLIAPRTPEHLVRQYAFDRKFAEFNKTVAELQLQVQDLSKRLEALEKSSTE